VEISSKVEDDQS